MALLNDKPCVAIIDDDEAVCSSVVDLMRAAGYDAECYESAEMFLKSSHVAGIECIIVDAHMPCMGGIDLLRKLRAEGLQVAVILLTALPDDELEKSAMSSGALCVLGKPFEGRALLEQVEASFSKR